ncbi:MAG: glycosyltransferase [Clostridia bacterium]|nr:glycosyltransferase [Clostridia bacterium]
MAKKVIVYAICKNEEKHAARFMHSMKEADGVYVLDTGSQDNSAKTLSSLGANVKRSSVSPWRFDAARNTALSLVPEDADICVCADLDEVFSKGWRRKLESAWGEKTQRARFRYVWSVLPDGSEGTVLYLDKIHVRHGYEWRYPVHEALIRTDGRAENPDETAYVPDMTLFHYPDPGKSRSDYLPLLELAVSENPLDARCIHYLGREYMYAGKWKKCISALRAHVSLPSSMWREEKSASYRYMARAHIALGQTAAAENALFSAIAQAPHLREPYFEMAKLLLHLGDAPGAYSMILRAIRIRQRPDCYVSEEEAWGDEAESILLSSKQRIIAEFSDIPV